MVVLEALQLYIVTWNIAGQRLPVGFDLTHLLSLDVYSNRPDMYVVGLQEATNDYFHIWTTWENVLEDILRIHHYEKLEVSRLLGIAMFIFVKEGMKHYISNVESGSTATGVWNFFGNKGGAVIRMDIAGTSLCLINSHLAANEGEAPRRLDDYWRILTSHVFKSASHTPSIYSHQHLFWLGDLNFRLAGGLSSGEIIAAVQRNDLPLLFERDELNNLMHLGIGFCGFNEAPIKFPPTYKFKRGTCDYTHSRRPAWTDRVLYKNNGKVVPITYNSVGYYNISDHKPVIATFTISTSGLEDDSLTIPLRDCRMKGHYVTTWKGTVPLVSSSVSTPISETSRVSTPVSEISSVSTPVSESSRVSTPVAESPSISTPVSIYSNSTMISNIV